MIQLEDTSGVYLTDEMKRTCPIKAMTQYYYPKQALTQSRDEDELGDKILDRLAGGNSIPGGGIKDALRSEA